MNIDYMPRSHQLQPSSILSPQGTLRVPLTVGAWYSRDYQREYQDTPFGLLVRKIAKLEYEAACAAFSVQSKKDCRVG